VGREGRRTLGDRRRVFWGGAKPCQRSSVIWREGREARRARFCGVLTMKVMKENRSIEDV